MAVADLFSSWNVGDRAVDPVLLKGKYINARSTLIAAGPPSYAQLSDSGISAAGAAGAVYPIGFVENFGMSQQKNLQRMFEIGSDRSYFIPGRTMASANLGRVLFHGPSLLRVMYAYYPQSKIEGLNTAGTTDNLKIAFTSNASNDNCMPIITESPGTAAPETPCDKASTGGGVNPTFYMNLASTLFDHPMGLLVYMRDINNEYYSAFYLEFSYVTAHNMNINASSTVVAEGVGLQFDRVVPVDLSVG